MPTDPIPFIDLKSQQERLRPAIDKALMKVLEHGGFIMGPEIGRLEDELCSLSGVRNAITCSSGTDALVLALMTLDVAKNDAVFIPSFTFAATAEAVVLAGATPVFVDSLPHTYNMDPASLEAAIGSARTSDLTPRVVIPVDLFGQPADYDEIEPIADNNQLRVVPDAAQSFGGTWRGRSVGTIGITTAVSFHPSKPLGCYGDGGAILTNDDELANRLRSLRVHGQGRNKYDNVRIGMNARLDTLQAAILLQKMTIFPEELEERRRVAARYDDGLRDMCRTPEVAEGAVSAWAQYTIVVERRDALRANLRDSDIPTRVYYPKPVHKQAAYRSYPRPGDRLPVAEMLSEGVLSLPMHPYLEKTTQDLIVDVIRKGLGSHG